MWWVSAASCNRPRTRSTGSLMAPSFHMLRFDGRMPDPDALLAELADAYGVAAEYWDGRGEHLAVRAETLTAVLAALGVDATTEQSRAAALEARRGGAWRSVLPPYVVARAGVGRTVEVHVPHGAAVHVGLLLEDGTD